MLRLEHILINARFALRRLFHAPHILLSRQNVIKYDIWDSMGRRFFDIFHSGQVSRIAGPFSSFLPINRQAMDHGLTGLRELADIIDEALGSGLKIDLRF